LDKISQFILHIIILNNITIKNGMNVIDIFMIIYIHPIFHRIKEKMLMAEYGLQTLQKSDSDQEESITYTIL